MSYRNLRMADAHLSLDVIVAGVNAEKAPILSDGGEGARRICRAADAEAEEERDLQLDNQRFVLLMVAEGMLVLGAADRLVPVLEQIVENGSNRQESIVRLSMKWRRNKAGARREYYRRVAELLSFFSANEIKALATPPDAVLHTAAQEI